MSITAPAVKATSAAWSWIFSTSLVLSAGAHFALFAWNPEMQTGAIDMATSELQMVDMLPPEIEIPPPPEAIARPAVPIIGTTQIDERITIAPTTFEANPVTSLPPPPVATEEPDADLRAAPRFTPYTVKPELKNTTEVKALLVKRYPPLLRDAGIGGTVLLWVFIDETGEVQRSLVKTSSGFPDMDASALQVAPQMRFTPALNRDMRVPVWLEIPLIFMTH